MQKIFYTKEINVDAGATTTIEIDAVPGARRARLNKATIHFPSHGDYYLQIHLYIGEESIIDGDGYITGDNVKHEIDIMREIAGGSVLKVKAVNTDSANPRKFFIILEYEIIE